MGNTPSVAASRVDKKSPDWSSRRRCLQTGQNVGRWAVLSADGPVCRRDKMLAAADGPSHLPTGPSADGTRRQISRWAGTVVLQHRVTGCDRQNAKIESWTLVRKARREELESSMWGGFSAFVPGSFGSQRYARTCAS